MSLPRLPRESLRSEEEEQELWQPTWKCFCCQDTGWIRSYLVTLVIPGYCCEVDKRPVCQIPGCEASDGLFNSSALRNLIDWRFTPEICQKLDAIAREDWRQTLLKQVQARLDLSQVGHSLRNSPRTPEEEMLAQQQHQAALAEVNKVEEVA
jgi:hypothetical protein